MKQGGGISSKYDIIKQSKKVVSLTADQLDRCNWPSFMDPYTHTQPISRVMTNFILTDHRGKPLNDMFVKNIQNENEEKSHYLLIGTLLPRPGSGLASIDNVSAKVLPLPCSILSFKMILTLSSYPIFLSSPPPSVW